MSKRPSDALPPLPFLGLSNADCAPMVHWTNKVLGHVNAPVRRRRVRPAAQSTLAKGSTVGGSNINRVGSARRLQSPSGPSAPGSLPLSAHGSTLTAMGAAGTTQKGDTGSTRDSGESTAADHSHSAEHESRVLHTQQLQAKLARTHEANVRAESNRHALQRAMQDNVDHVHVPNTVDLQRLDHRNYARPDADQRDAARVAEQRKRESGFRQYLQRAVFSDL